MQEKDTFNPPYFAGTNALPGLGRILALDPGTKRIGVAISDELRITVRALPRMERTSWKKILSNICVLVAEFDAKAVVVGLPLESDGSESEMSAVARDMARKLGLSLPIPVFLQDERVTSYEAKHRLWSRGADLKETRARVDSEAAAIILEDFLSTLARTSADS